MAKFSKKIKWLKSPTGKYNLGQSIGDEYTCKDEEAYKEFLESGWGCDSKDYESLKAGKVRGEHYHKNGQPGSASNSELDAAVAQANSAKTDYEAKTVEAEEALQKLNEATEEYDEKYKEAEATSENARSAEEAANKMKEKYEALIAEMKDVKGAPGENSDTTQS